MIRSSIVRTLTMIATVATALSAQAQPQHLTGGNEGKKPIGWKSRADGGSDAHGGKDTLSFVQMTPGFHVTTGPGVILWHPDSSATGSFAIDGGIFLFPTSGRDEEGYGIFVGGHQLDGPEPRYTYFLLRNDGKFLIKQRNGAHMTVLKEWTASPAIKLQKGTDAMQNNFRIVAGPQTVAFSVNGTEVASLPRAQVSPDGVYGLRFNHAVNAHVVKVAKGK